jgi:hypothetical protein
VRRSGTARGEDELALVPPPANFQALCRVRVPDEGGMVRCPLPDHDDAYASCQVYAEAEQGWWCFGCGRGGRTYDLASLLSGSAWGREPRGEAFHAARQLVAAALRDVPASTRTAPGVTAAARGLDRSATLLVDRGEGVADAHWSRTDD